MNVRSVEGAGRLAGRTFTNEGIRMTQANSTEYEQLVEDYGDLWNGDFSKLDIVAESVDIYSPAHPDGEVHGRDEFEEFLRHIHEAIPDFEITKNTEEMLTSDDTVMYEWTLQGTAKGDFYGLPPTGRQVNISGMSKMTITDGKIQKDKIVFNQKEMLDQLGFAFPDIIPLSPKLAWGKISEAI